MANHLKGQTSPYLLQHAENPVDWYPWSDEAFEKAKAEDKPVFLSIGYSTCHWCHVMAHESFEDAEIAEILNAHFVAIKVDKEERPDIDSVYMAVCQAYTGSGGWPMSIFMTAERKPFFAGTYFPKHSRQGFPGFSALLGTIIEKWENDRETLLASADAITSALARQPQRAVTGTDNTLPSRAAAQFARSFDAVCGGFGDAPKFPSPQNLLFLMQYAQKQHDDSALRMAEKTLTQLRRGGIFDQIGYGFSRYSTDRRFLVPHFEKMLCDNAMLILAYCRAYECTGTPLFKQTAAETADYVLSEMVSPEGAFYSAQDADSDGEEGKFYVFSPDEIRHVLGERDGAAFCKYFDITSKGNFAGKSIPNLLSTEEITDHFDVFLPALREYRKRRASLHTDDKILLTWNSLIIAALCALYRISANADYLNSAVRALHFLDSSLCEKDTLYVSYRAGARSGKGFLDEYAAYTFALLALYDVTLDASYLTRAAGIADKTIRDFFDAEKGGFYLSGAENEKMLFPLKESYDGALPSGNSLMAWNLVRLQLLAPDESRGAVLRKQLAFLSSEADAYPAGHAMFLMALSDYFSPPETVTIVRCRADEDLSPLVHVLPGDSIVRVEDASSGAHPLLHGETTVYACRNSVCLPPVSLPAFLDARKAELPSAQDEVTV